MLPGDGTVDAGESNSIFEGRERHGSRRIVLVRGLGEATPHTCTTASTKQMRVRNNEMEYIERCLFVLLIGLVCTCTED